MSGEDQVSRSAGDGETGDETSDRRDFLSKTSTVAMAGGLLAGYGAFGAMAVRYLYPADKPNVALRFVATVGDFKVGESREFTTPSGAKVVIARHGEEPESDSFIALSSVCPHLGCQVHWEEKNDRFFCPCHNGAFDREGVATEGPPAMAKQSLKKFPVQVINGLLFIEAPMTSVATKVAQLDAKSIQAQPPTREA